MADVEVSNKQVLLRDYVSGFPKESAMYVTSSTLKLKLPQASKGLLVKNLYLSCDPYMRNRMKKLLIPGSYADSFKPHSVSNDSTHSSTLHLFDNNTHLYVTLQPIRGFGVAKVIESGDPNFNQGDLVWGITGWEEYSIINATQSLFKIHDTSVPLSYYTGILGNLLDLLIYLFIYSF